MNEQASERSEYDDQEDPEELIAEYDRENQEE